jgi:hypothetical protein
MNGLVRVILFIVAVAILYSYAHGPKTASTPEQKQVVAVGSAPPPVTEAQRRENELRNGYCLNRQMRQALDSLEIDHRLIAPDCRSSPSYREQEEYRAPTAATTPSQPASQAE